MANRERRPGKYTGPPPSSGGSSGDGILGKFMAPKLNDQFGKTATGADPDDGVAIAEQEAQNAASQNLYNTPTGWQRFFAPEASQRADTANADLSAHRVLSKEDAASSLYNAQELAQQQQNFGVTNALTKVGADKDTANTLAGVNKDTAGALATSQAKAAATQQGFSVAAKTADVTAAENVVNSERANAVAVKRAADIANGQAAEDSLGFTNPNRNNIMPIVQTKPSDDQLIRMGNALRLSGGADMAQKGALSMVSGAAANNALNTLSADVNNMPEMRAAMLAKQQKEGYLQVGPSERQQSLNPNLPSWMGQVTSQSYGINPLTGYPNAHPDITTTPPRELPSALATRAAEDKMKAEGAAFDAKNPPSLVTPTVDVAPAATQLAGILQGKEDAALAEKIKGFTQRKEGGQISSSLGGGYNYIPGRTAPPATGNELEKILEQLIPLQARQEAIKQARKKPVSKQ